MDKIEIVKEQLGAMTLNEMINGYYVRFRKSKNNKLMLEDIFEDENIANEDGWYIIGTYEVRLTDEAFERIYTDYMNKIFSKSF